ncbi:cytochrome P450 [Gigaspora rosea]|uniref:Cytochrome P450 n=1 Tax=Gigaspora rosea TaxID=44941 RepID=A0A397UXQ3_9GLOM|nr:cytochrome P450 [Gigaspora rosea]
MISILIESTYIQLLIVLVGLIAILNYFHLTRKRVKLNEPPIVDYQIPMIGHTLRFIYDCEKLIVESREKYGEIYSLYIFGELITVVGKDSIGDLYRRENDFDFYSGTDVKLVVKYIFDDAFKDLNKSLKFMKDYFKVNLNNIMDRIEQNVIKSIDIYIGECNEPKVFNDSHEALKNVFAFVAMNLFLGEECGHNEEIFELFKNLVSSFVKAFYAPKILSFVHHWFHDQVATFSLRYISKYKQVIIKHIKLIIKKRFHEKKKLGDAWIPPTDVLQFFLNDPEIAPDLDPNNVNCNLIADIISIFILAAMSSTSYRASYALYELAKRKEDWPELYQEAQQINEQCNGNFKTCDDLDKMVKLDRFIKEAFRLNADLLGLPRQCITDTHYTFSNGYQIPSGRMVSVDVLELYRNENFQGPNPNEFNASRHNSPATKLDRNFLLFGHGKHICPGRNYAVTLTKITLHHIMLKYNLRTKFENRIPRNHIGFFIAPARPGDSSIIFEKNN